MNRLKFYVLALALLGSVCMPLLVSKIGSAAFNPNLLISDNVFSSSGTMDAGQIDAFLEG